MTERAAALDRVGRSFAKQGLMGFLGASLTLEMPSGNRSSIQPPSERLRSRRFSALAG